MSDGLDVTKLSDRELLLVLYTNQTNHLRHHDIYLKVALSAALMGVINFGAALVLMVVKLA